MRRYLIFVLTIITATSHGQEFLYPSIKANGKTVDDFVPVSWAILDSAKGDLNKDGTKDFAVILQHKDKVRLVTNKDTVIASPRILLILFRNSLNTGLQLKEQSNSFILKHDNAAMDDPYQKLTIAKEILEIRFRLFYNMGSWFVTNASYKFRYQKGQFVLIGADNSSFHRGTHDYENYSYNFLTRKRTITKGNDNKGSKKSTSKIITISTLQTLSSFSEPFTWEVEKGIYL